MRIGTIRNGILAGLAIALVVAATPVHAGTMHVKNDSVGIGDFSAINPSAKLHIKVPSGNANFRLQNGGSTWAFTNTAINEFTVNKIGSGGQEFSVRTRNNAGGVSTMAVQGSIDATAFNTTSSRALKSGFTEVDTVQLLERLVSIPVTEWRFKEDGSGAKHIGPMAEDFQATFGLGDGQTISLTDANGITIAAIQGLHAGLVEKQQEIERLQSQVDELKSLVQALLEADRP